VIARVSRAGERVFAIANFFRLGSVNFGRNTKERLFRRDAETSTRAARALQISAIWWK